MTWCRFGDEFTFDQRWDGVSYEARWHLMAMVALCSKSERFDCKMPLVAALRASDVMHPQECLDVLQSAGFVLVNGYEVEIIDGEARHMPPVSVRERKRKADQRSRTRKHRQKRCNDGIHDSSCPRSCPSRTKDIRNNNGNALPQDRTEQNRAVKDHQSGKHVTNDQTRDEPNVDLSPSNPLAGIDEGEYCDFLPLRAI